MATIHLRGGSTGSFSRWLTHSIGLKVGASIAALLFAMCAFFLPNPIARVVTGVLAIGFGGLGAAPPMADDTRLRLFAWAAAFLGIAGFCVSVFRVVGADHTRNVPVFSSP